MRTKTLPAQAHSPRPFKCLAMAASIALAAPHAMAKPVTGDRYSQRFTTRPITCWPNYALGTTPSAGAPAKTRSIATNIYKLPQPGSYSFGDEKHRGQGPRQSFMRADLT